MSNDTTINPSVERQTEIMGLSDGECSILALVLSTILFSTLHGFAVGVLAEAGSAASSMAMGTWFSTRNRRLAAVMFCSSAVGLLAPAVPFFLTQSAPAFVACGLIAVGVASVVAHLRELPAPRCYIETYAGLVVATGVGVLLGALA